MILAAEPTVGRVLTLEDDLVRAAVLPDHGGDIASIVDRATGTGGADAEIPGDLLPADGRWDWPDAEDRAGRPLDLRRLPRAGEPHSVFAYLEDFEEHEAIEPAGTPVGVPAGGERAGWVELTVGAT